MNGNREWFEAEIKTAVKVRDKAVQTIEALRTYGLLRFGDKAAQMLAEAGLAPAPSPQGERPRRLHRARTIPSPAAGKSIIMNIGKYKGFEGRVSRALRLPKGGVAFMVVGLHDPKAKVSPDTPLHKTTIREHRQGTTWRFARVPA